MYILGISAYYHDSAAALLKDGEVLVAIQEERCTGLKHDASFPIHAIQHCIDFAGIKLQELDQVVFYDKPFLKFERILETFSNNAPKGFLTFLKVIPLWIKEKLFLKNSIKKELTQLDKIDFKKTKLLFTEHHLAHAASTFFTSPFAEAAIVTVDGVGEWTTTSICVGNQNQIKILEEIKFPNSIGLLYSACTYFLGFKVNSAEYKVMGLAPYAKRDNEQVQGLYKLMKENLVHVHEDASYALNREYFAFEYAKYMINTAKWEKLFNMKSRKPEAPLELAHCFFACAIQLLCEELLLNICNRAKQISHSSKLCLSGGVALNCVANARILGSHIFDDIFIQPAAGDAGGALGAALAVHYIYLQNERKISPSFNPYLGPNLDIKELDAIPSNSEIEKSMYENEAELLTVVAQALAEGQVVAWVQDRMEWGPRALGNRSILANPMIEDMQTRINQSVKKREGFRPFAPVVLEEDASLYFEITSTSPHMMFTYPLKKSCSYFPSENTDNWSIKEQLHFKKSEFPCITHVDYSARVQTVNSTQNKKLYQLLSSFKKISGVGMLVNTSFNIRSKPIVMNVKQAYECFQETDIDILVINNCLFKKL